MMGDTTMTSMTIRNQFWSMITQRVALNEKRV